MNEQESVEQIAYAEAMCNKANAREMLQKVHKEDHRYAESQACPHSLRHGLRRCADDLRHVRQGNILNEFFSQKRKIKKLHIAK
jgi:hypothetical protein